ncbi:T9SS type A sorting domain-containing protein [Dyadobacter sp. CY107]|uniref:T9SS type A sorting domain-containing protein n=1 Tax=Dyadobacter fanqingshengii TaxID=2906443 RepID=UPI001F1CEE64|nr:T9SS type A sorting domain-containing protein [Dyadobacter fanqingshengii]MCF2505363.1 T9SS type A sorting domain-containing protein [Dyadobacter fanqingshengii]
MKGIFTVMLFLFCFKAMAQCPSTGYITLYTQSDVDNYFANGGCTVVENLILGDGSPDITNLNGLNGITTITGELQIYWLPLVDFTGLETLTNLGRLYMEWCPQLKDFKGLENLKALNSLELNNMDSFESFAGLEGVTITGGFGFGGCPALTTVSGFNVADELSGGIYFALCPLLADISNLSNLKSAAGLTVAGCDLIEDFQWVSSLEVLKGFTVGSNANLTSLHGLENLQTAEAIEITSSPQLSNLNALENLQTVKTIYISNSSIASLEPLGNISSRLTEVNIFFNPLLSNCTVDFICSMLLDPAQKPHCLIFANQGICQDRNQLELACKETMPVTLVSFDAFLEKKLVNLIWKTSEEYNSEKFEVHHSTNGKDWSVIGEVKSSGIGGLGSEYHFTHQTPAQGNNYYRLKMIDFDRTHALSTISHAYFNAVAETVYPNPTSDAIHISSLNPGKIVSFELVNSKGSVVMKRQSGKTDAINLDKFPAGYYTLRIIRKDSTVSNHKIIVSK